jgi:uncharacterized protein (DUF952 family)
VPVQNGQSGTVSDGSEANAARFIFHIALVSEWKSAEEVGTYRVSTRGRSFEDVGFIHAGFEHQVPRVGAEIYKDVAEPLVVLVIDTERVDVPIRVENLEGGNEGFPHIYGPLRVCAVVDVRPANLTADGRFIVGEPRDRG